MFTIWHRGATIHARAEKTYGLLTKTLSASSASTISGNNKIVIVESITK